MTKENKYKTTSYLLRRFLPYYKKYFPTLFLDLTCAGFSTICDLVLPLILRYMTNTARNNLNDLTFKLIFTCSAIFLFLRVFDTVANYYMQNIGHIMGAKIETDMRYDIFNHIQSLPYSYFNNHKSGQILARITSDLFDVTEFSHHCPEEFFIASVKVVVSFLILININIPLTITIFAVIPFMIYFISKYNKMMKITQKRQREQTGEINTGIENNILGARVVKSFANEDLEVEKFHKENLLFLDIKKGYYKNFALMQVISRTFDGIMYLIVIIFGGYLMMKGNITPGDMFLYTLYINMLLATCKRLVDFMELFQKGMTGIERYIEIMDEKNDIVDSENAIELKDVKGNILFDDVAFSYKDKSQIILKNFNLDIKAGENVALVGSSGVGDSDIMMTDTINPLKSKFKGFHKTFKQDDLGLSLSSFLLN